MDKFDEMEAKINEFRNFLQDRVGKDPQMNLSSYVNMRFWEKITFNRENGCWIWGGAKSSNGNGIFHISENDTNIRATAYAWKLAEPDFDIRDKRIFIPQCGSQSCVRPSHMLLTTRHRHVQHLLKTTGFNKKTHCKYGHELSDDNLVPTRNGQGRRCKTCVRQRDKKVVKA